MNKVRYQPNQN
ncbi:erythromycin resistance leader peptide [Staphylococcus aureus]|nr:erythromycin resistance leader peptide [Staphylococcus aureus]